MGKITLTKRSLDRRLPKKDVLSYIMSDESALDSNSDSGLDLGCTDSEDLSPEEPCSVFKNPDLNSYENALDKLLFPILRAHHSPFSTCEPASKKPRMNKPHRSPTRFGVQQPTLSSNYVDLLFEETNLECPEREAPPLPELQTVLKTILRTESCNGTQDLTPGPRKSGASSKTPPQSLQSNETSNGSARNGSNLGTSHSGPGHRLPLGRRQLTLCINFPCKTKGGQVELRILSQPEEQHRARYLTEGSRGAVKDRNGSGYPTVKLFGYCKPVTLQVFIGTDQGKVQPHLFYQASKVCGKNSAPCNQKKIDGTVVLELSLLPEKDMTLSCDCIGILKERNVDVEQRLLHFGGTRSKKRSTRCRLVFRALIAADDGSVEILQTASAPIVCTQPPGIPEICRKSLSETSAIGNVELFVIGKNFLKDTEVVFEECSLDAYDDHSVSSTTDFWKKIVTPEKDFLQPNHLICTVPPYHDTKIRHPVRVRLLVQSSGKRSEYQNFTYLPVASVVGPLPGLTPLQNCVSDTAMGLVQQSPQKTDMLPALIQLPFTQQHQHQEQQQQTGSILGMPPTQEISSHLKQEEGGSQKMVITTLVIPSSAEGTLSQATANQILQDSQQAIQAVTSSAATSVAEQSLKPSHIQVLVMPPSSTVSVTTSPQQVTNSSQSFQDSIIHSLKNKLSPNVMNFCVPQNVPNTAQNQVEFRDMTNAESRGLGGPFPQTGFQLSTANSFASLPKEVRTIQDLLLQSSVKSSMFETNQQMSRKMEETESQNGLLGSSSLQNRLGASLENIPLQSLMQTNPNSMTNNLQGPSVQQSNGNNLELSSFVINPNGSSNFNSIDQKGTNFSNILQKQNVDNVFHMEQNIVKNEPKDSDVMKAPSGFEMSYNSVMLNSEATNSVHASDIAQKNGQSLLQNENSMPASFSGAIGSFFSQHNEASQSSQHAFDRGNIPNPILVNALAGVNLSQAKSSRDLKSFNENVQISMASQSIFQMPTINTLAPSLGKSISISESQGLSISETFPTTTVTTNNLNTNANTSSMNFQDNFDLTLSKPITSSSTVSTFSIQDSFLNKDFNKDMMILSKQSEEQCVTNSEMKFDQSLLNKESTSDVLMNQSLLTSQSVNTMPPPLPLDEKFHSKLSMDNMQFTTNSQMGMQDLNSVSNDANSVRYQINAKLSEETGFMASNSGPVSFQNLQEQLNVARSVSESIYQPSSTVTSIRDLQSNMLTSGSITNSQNQSIILQGKQMPNESKMTNDSSNFTTPTSDNITMPSLAALSQEFSNSENASRIEAQNSIMSFTTTENVGITKSEQSLQEAYSSESLTAIGRPVDNFATASQSITIIPEAPSIQFGQKNITIVSAIPVKTMQEALSLQEISPMNPERDETSFTATSQNLTMVSEAPVTFNVSQGMTISPGKILHESFSNQNLDCTNVSFATANQSISVPSEPSVQESYTQEKGVSYASSTQETFSSQNLGNVCNTQDMVLTFPNKGENSASERAQVNFAQQNLSTPMNSSQDQTTSFTTTTNAQGIINSGAQSGSAGGSSGGPSMEQMSTMMSMLPDAELLKIINPSTFD